MDAGPVEADQVAGRAFLVGAFHAEFGLGLLGPFEGDLASLMQAQSVFAINVDVSPGVLRVGVGQDCVPPAAKAVGQAVLNSIIKPLRQAGGPGPRPAVKCCCCFCFAKNVNPIKRKIR